MSQIELTLLKDLEISQKELAAALQVSPQRVSQGIRERGSYFTPARLQALYLHLAASDAARAERFRQNALKVIPRDISGVLLNRAAAVTSDPMTEPAITRKGTLRPWLESEEIWVFASRPKEIEQPEYLERMEREFFNQKNPGARRITRIVYFVPTDVSDVLCRYLAASFLKIDPADRAEVVVIESPAIAICPKFLIFDAMSGDPRGFVACEGYDTYARLSQRQLDHILDGLRAAGIGGRKDQILVPPLSGTRTASAELFNVRFSSRDVSYDHS